MNSQVLCWMFTCAAALACNSYPGEEGAAETGGSGSTMVPHPGSSGTSSPPSAGATPGNGGSSPSAGAMNQPGNAGADMGGGGTLSGGPSTGADKPGGLLDLKNWKLTLPIGDPGDPDEVRQPELQSFQVLPWFHVNDTTNGVVFRANAGGVTTGGSKYPRSELREMTPGGEDEAAWYTKSGVHRMTIKQAVTHLPQDKDEVVVGQIHDNNDDIVMIRLSGKTLFVEGASQNLGTLDDSYELDTVFSVRLEASGSHVRVYYNGDDQPKVDVERDVGPCYFKAGVYTQANTESDPADSYGEVVIHELSVSHE